jgi:hypothetical protein
LFFHEIPGRPAGQDFDCEPLSHPLDVEVIEELSVPAVVYNYRESKDEYTFSRLTESSWNNPLIRSLDSRSKDVIPRATDIGTTAAYNKQNLPLPEHVGDRAVMARAHCALV